jgi:hypothetical protein
LSVLLQIHQGLGEGFADLVEDFDGAPNSVQFCSAHNRKINIENDGLMIDPMDRSFIFPLDCILELKLSRRP